MKKSRFLISSLLAAGILPASQLPAQESAGTQPKAKGPDPDDRAVVQRFALEHNFQLAQHRSHSSHASHSSHRSGTSGRPRTPSYTPPAPRVPRATPTPAPRPAPAPTRNERSTPPSSILPSSPETARQSLLPQVPGPSEPSGSQVRLVLMRVQISLMAAGYYEGDIDGLMGPMTRSALERYQRASGFAVTGTVTPEVLDAFRISLE